MTNQERIQKAREFRDAAEARLAHTEALIYKPVPDYIEEREVYRSTLFHVADGCRDRIGLIDCLFPEVKAMPVQTWPYPNGEPEAQVAK